MSFVNINSVEYKATTSIKLGLESEVQKHATEKGFAISDHIKHQPPTFEVSIILGGGGATGGKDRQAEYSALKELRDKGATFTFISNFGAFNDMVISSLSPAIENSNNTYSCSLTVMQVRVAELKTEYFTITDKDGKPIYSPVKPAGVPPTQSLFEAQSEEANELARKLEEELKNPLKSKLMVITEWVKDHTK